jgi:hypothetical protein
MGVEETEEGGGIASGFRKAEVAEVEVAVVEGEGEAGGDGGALRRGETCAESVQSAAQEKEEWFEGFESVFEFLCDLEMLRWAVQGEEAMVFAVKNVVQASGFGTETFGEPLARKSGEVAQGADTPEVEEVEVEGGGGSIQGPVFSIQTGEGEVANGLNTEHGIPVFAYQLRRGRLDPDLRIGVEAELRCQLRTMDCKQGEIWRGGEGEVERKTERSGLAEGLFDPVKGRAMGVGKSEEIEEEGAGGGFLEVGAERGREVTEFVLVPAFEERVGREERELRAAGEGAGGGETGSEALSRGGAVDREEDGSGVRLRRQAGGGIGGRADEGSGCASSLGVVPEEDGEREGRDVEACVHAGKSKVESWEVGSKFGEDG